MKRLFLALASRQQFQRIKPVLDAADRGEVSLGRGKRSLAKGGKFDSKYRITVPDDSDICGWQSLPAAGAPAGAGHFRDLDAQIPSFEDLPVR